MMMQVKPSYTVYPLGDTAICIDFGNRIDEPTNDRVMALFRCLQKHPLKGMLDLVPAYSSLSLHYDPAAWLPEIRKGISVSDILSRQLMLWADRCGAAPDPDPRRVRIPVCYEAGYAPDLAAMAEMLGLPVAEIIAQHAAREYRVYMLGFLPGFAYMGEVNTAIAMPRKQRPVSTCAGSVGIAGRQTGIYPLASPGGWQIIGRTPLQLFSADTGNTLLQPGDRVQFYAISSYEFEHY